MDVESCHFDRLVSHLFPCFQAQKDSLWKTLAWGEQLPLQDLAWKSFDLTVACKLSCDGIFESSLEIDSACALHVCYLIDAVHILEQLFLCKNL